MFCPQCGAQNSGASNYCVRCGHKLNSSTVTAQDIRVGDLPEACRSRLLAALKNVPPETFVINESALGWAATGFITAILGVAFVVSQASGYKWQLDDLVTNVLVLATSFVVGWISASYLVKWLRSDFKAYTLLNPLYILRFRFGRIQAINLHSTDAWDIKHLSDTRGRYTGTRFYFRGNGKQNTLKIKSLKVANEIILALKRFPGLVSRLITDQDSSALYSFDLLYEWRRREESFPQPTVEPPTRLTHFFGRTGPILLPAGVAALVFFLLILPYNDSCDDELRWHTAETTATATAYRIYVASRPDGRHVSDAYSAISALYDRAAANYKEASASIGSQGTEAIIRILEYAKATGHYRVVVIFSGDNQIPDDIDARLRSLSGLTHLVPVLPSFTPSMNRAREARILERISASFGKVIPGDVLQFVASRSTPQDPVFNVDYTIKASGTLYYPGKEERLPEANRDWYTGISFLWNFNIVVPGDTTQFAFSLDSRPADLFNVVYQSSDGSDQEFSPLEAYGAMADSAFDDFGSKLLSELSVGGR